MARANIARIRPDGSGDHIYLHYGEPLENATILLEHYQTEGQIQALLALGALSSIGPMIGERIDFYQVISCPTLRDAQCVAYHRDRSDPWLRCRPLPFTGGLDGFRQAASDMVQWLYAHTPDGWTACRAEPNSRWESIPNVVLAEAASQLDSIRANIRFGGLATSALGHRANQIAAITNRPWQPPALRQLLADAVTE